MGLEEDVTYPTNEEEWVKTIAVGTVLEYLAFLILPAWILAGYYVRVMRRRLAGDPEPPTFADPGELLVDGFKASVIFWIYNLVTILAFVVLVVGGLLALLAGEPGAGIGSILFGLFVTLVLAAVFSYGGAAGVVRFAETGSVTAAFSPGLVRVVVSPTWLVAWLKILAVSAAASVVLGIVGLIPIVHFVLVVLAPAKVKYVGTVVAKVFADAYAEVTDATAGATRAPAASAA